MDEMEEEVFDIGLWLVRCISGAIEVFGFGSVEISDDLPNRERGSSDPHVRTFSISNNTSSYDRPLCTVD